MTQCSWGILGSYLKDAFAANGALCPTNLLERNIANKGGGFLSPLSFYLDILDNTDEVMIPYLSAEKKEQLRHDLRIAELLLHTQNQYEYNHQKIENKKKYEEHLRHCQHLLAALDPSPQSIIPELSDGVPVKYCGISLAQEFAQQMHGLINRKSKTLKEALDALNEKRLYWIWGSVFLKTVLSLVPDNFFNSKQAMDTISAPDPYTGCLSWTLYYFRGSLSLFLLLKHTIKGPWMEEGEKTLPFSDRFQTQWAQRKFNLLNDFIWGTANLLCFFWLTTKNGLGAYGDALTIMLLVFDISMVLWDFAEQETEYKRKIAQFEADIAAMGTLHGEQYQYQIDALKRAKAQCETEWMAHKHTLYTNIAYALGLTLAFVLLTMPFIPVLATAVVPFVAVGAVLCFAFTVVSNAIKGGIEIHKTHRSLKEAKNEFRDRVARLKLMLNNPSSDKNEQKFLYLEIKKLNATTEYQKKMIMFQSIRLVRTILIEALIPAVIFATLVFFPLGIGLAAMGAALGLAIGSYYLINALFKPDERMKKLPEFNEKEYDDFCKLIKNDSCDQKCTYAFFKSKKNTDTKDTVGEYLSSGDGVNPLPNVSS